MIYDVIICLQVLLCCLKGDILCEFWCRNCRKISENSSQKRVYYLWTLLNVYMYCKWCLCLNISRNSDLIESLRNFNWPAYQTPSFNYHELWPWISVCKIGYVWLLHSWPMAQWYVLKTQICLIIIWSQFIKYHFLLP